MGNIEKLFPTELTVSDSSAPYLTNTWAKKAITIHIKSQLSVVWTFTAVPKCESYATVKICISRTFAVLFRSVQGKNILPWCSKLSRCYSASKNLCLKNLNTAKTIRQPRITGLISAKSAQPSPTVQFWTVPHMPSFCWMT